MKSPWTGVTEGIGKAFQEGAKGISERHTEVFKSGLRKEEATHEASLKPKVLTPAEKAREKAEEIRALQEDLGGSRPGVGKAGSKKPVPMTREEAMEQIAQAMAELEGA